jgi:hypothetical protein
MLDRKQELERIGRERLATEREASRETLRAALKCLAGCVVSCVIGMVILGLAFHVNDEQLGWIYFWSGLIIGDSGMIYFLATFYRRGEERGDW